VAVNARNVGPGRAIRKRKSMKRRFPEGDRFFFCDPSGATLEERFELVVANGALSEVAAFLEKKNQPKSKDIRCLSSDISFLTESDLE
jgi:hypothetical protein